MGMFDMFMPNPADKGMDYLNKISPMLHDINDPYIKRGNDQYAGLNDVYGRMGQNPTDFLEQMMKGYAPSRGFQLKRDEASRAAGNSAAAGGMRGTQMDQEGQQRLADSLMGEDMQQWLGNVMGIQGKGLAGQQHFYDQGFDASQGMAGNLANVLGSQAQLGMQGQSYKNQSLSDLLSGLAQTGAMAGGAYMGAGGGGGWASKIAGNPAGVQASNISPWMA